MTQSGTTGRMRFSVRWPAPRPTTCVTVAAAVYAALLAGGAAAQSPAYLVKDIDQQRLVGAASPSGLATLGQQVLFQAYTPRYGTELWRSDGSEDGTQLLADLEAGRASSTILALTGMGNIAYFFRQPAESLLDVDHLTAELWVTDGSALGTRRVTTIPAPLLGHASPVFAVGLAGRLLWMIADASAQSLTLWTSDGTDSGTAQIARVDGVPDVFELNPHFVAAGGIAAFTWYEPQRGFEPWRSDGTAAGTTRLADGLASVDDCGNADSVVRRGDALLIFNRDQDVISLLSSDGSSDGTRRLATLPEFAGVHGVVTIADRVYFIVSNDARDTLWSSDGSAAGTGPVFDLSTMPNWLFTSGDRLFYWMAASVTQLFGSDGTANGTAALLSVPGNSPSALPSFGAAHLLYFLASGFAGDGSMLWRSDGRAAGTTPLAPFDPRTTSFLGAVDDRLYFVADDGSGAELWKSDGTAPSTQRVRNIAPDDVLTVGSEPHALAAAGNRLWFAVGAELWRSDGTANGTSLVRDLGGAIAQITPVGEQLYIRTTDGLWTVSAEDSATPTQLIDGRRVGKLIELSGAAYASVDSTLCRFEAAAAPRCTLALAADAEYAATGGRLFFVAPDEVSSHNAVWTSDGLAAGQAVRVAPVPSPSDYGYAMTAVGSRVYFVASEDEDQLWVSDGSTAGTHVVRDDIASPGQSIESLTAGAQHLYFRVRDFDTAVLWASDGSSAGTQDLGDVDPGFAPATIGDRVLFNRFDAEHGWELWGSDATLAGTQLIKDIVPGVRSSGAFRFRAVDGGLAFTGCDTAGCEPWVTDGTSAGTRALADVVPGPGDSAPDEFTAVRGRLFFSADDLLHGRELWAIPFGAAPPCEADCDGNGRVTIDELVAAIGIALGTSDASCAAADSDADGVIRIAELVAAVARALNGCD